MGSHSGVWQRDDLDKLKPYFAKHPDRLYLTIASGAPDIETFRIYLVVPIGILDTYLYRCSEVL
jgi:hypothetical protein